MNRTDRLLAIILELQAKNWQRAEDLASTFETSVRTIYRDIQALSEAGVPLVAIPGRGYSLMEGYFLPPLTFSTVEAGMLLLGADVMAQSFDAQYRAAAETAARKIIAVLPDDARTRVNEIRQSVRFLPPRGGPPEEQLASLRRAIAERITVRITYHSRYSSDGGGAESTRLVDPYTLASMNESWYVTGHDHLRSGARTFRLDRIEAIETTEESFQRPPDAHLFGGRPSGRAIEIVALFDPSVVRWVRESRSFYLVSEARSDEGLLATFRVRHEREILPWLLGWGRNVRVISPQSVREEIAIEGRALAEHHSQTDSEPKSND